MQSIQDNMAQSKNILPMVFKQYQLIGYDAVMKLVGVKSRQTIDAWEAEGNFPKRKVLSRGKIAWRLEEVLRWIDTRPAA